MGTVTHIEKRLGALRAVPTRSPYSPLVKQPSCIVYAEQAMLPKFDGRKAKSKALALNSPTDKQFSILCLASALVEAKRQQKTRKPPMSLPQLPPHPRRGRRYVPLKQAPQAKPQPLDAWVPITRPSKSETPLRNAHSRRQSVLSDVYNVGKPQRPLQLHLPLGELRKVHSTLHTSEKAAQTCDTLGKLPLQEVVEEQHVSIQCGDEVLDKPRLSTQYLQLDVADLSPGSSLTPDAIVLSFKASTTKEQPHPLRLGARTDKREDRKLELQLPPVLQPAEGPRQGLRKGDSKARALCSKRMRQMGLQIDKLVVRHNRPSIIELPEAARTKKPSAKPLLRMNTQENVPQDCCYSESARRPSLPPPRKVRVTKNLTADFKASSNLVKARSLLDKQARSRIQAFTKTSAHNILQHNNLKYGSALTDRRKSTREFFHTLPTSGQSFDVWKPAPWDNLALLNPNEESFNTPLELVGH